MRELSNAIIYHDEKILVVDKNKWYWEILTILPWWKLDEWESLIESLKRELEEELSVYNIQIDEVLWKISWNSPTLNIKSNVTFYKVNIGNQKIITNAEVENPRYLSFNEILNLETTTDMTKKIVNYLIKKKNND